nr:helix-turn-helix domain-containing protein [Noviherbaspirillum malthae]
MRDTHLSQDERYQIYILQKAGHDCSSIAMLMKRHKSTISRELQRNRGERGYRPAQAHQQTVVRRRTNNGKLTLPRFHVQQVMQP